MKRLASILSLALISPLIAAVSFAPVEASAFSIYDVCDVEGTRTNPAVKTTGFFGGGSGTPDRPWLICSRAQLAGIAENPTTRGADFKIMKNLDLGGSATPWTPLDAGFNGVLDGNFKTISGLYISSPAADGLGNFGLFSATDSATIKQLIIDSPIIDSTWSGASTVGGRGPSAGVIAGVSSATQVQDVFISSPNISGVLVSAGFVFGRAQSPVADQVRQVHVTSGSITGDYTLVTKPKLGGIVGYGAVNVHRASIEASIVGVQEGAYLGGVLGWAKDGSSTVSETFTDVDFSGTYANQSYTNVGGVVGEDFQGLVGSDLLIAGGVADNSFDGYSGGFAGAASSSGTKPIDTVVVGDFHSPNIDNVGPVYGSGLAAADPGDVFYDTDTYSGTGSEYGTPKSTSALQSFPTYDNPGFDIVTSVPQGWTLASTSPIWKIDDGNAYPELIWIDESLERFTASDTVLPTLNLYLYQGEEKALGPQSLGDYDSFAVSGLDTSKFEWATSGNLLVSSPPLTGAPYSFDLYASKGSTQVKIPIEINVASGSLIKTITDLTAGDQTATIGDEIFASAYERYLDVDLTTTGLDSDRVEEYVYRITKVENDDSTSVDLQAADNYTALSAEAQNVWYDNDWGGRNSYDFSWNAFLCYDTTTFELSIPTDMKSEYMSLEDHLVAGELEPESHALFREFTDQYVSSNLSYASTVVGQLNVPNLKGVWSDGYSAFGGLSVTGNCASGSEFQSMPIWQNEAPVFSKSLTIDENISVAKPFDFGATLELPAAGVTIGVTGGGVSFNAALWGLTTIAEPESEAGFAAPAPFPGPIISGQAGGAVTAGQSVTISGSNMDSVTSVLVGGVEAEISSQSDSSVTIVLPEGLAAGSQDAVIVSSSGNITLTGYFEVLGTQSQSLDFSFWTKRISGTEANFYAKNVVGEGKIQFFHNGNEIAWVNAETEADPKLRQANGSYYLVRTRELIAGKNVFEIYVDGERVRRTIYSIQN